MFLRFQRVPRVFSCNCIDQSSSLAIAFNYQIHYFPVKWKEHFNGETMGPSFDCGFLVLHITPKHCCRLPYTYSFYVTAQRQQLQSERRCTDLWGTAKVTQSKSEADSAPKSLLSDLAKRCKLDWNKTNPLRQPSKPQEPKDLLPTQHRTSAILGRFYWGGCFMYFKSLSIILTSYLKYFICCFKLLLFSSIF